MKKIGERAIKHLVHDIIKKPQKIHIIAGRLTNSFQTILSQQSPEKIQQIIPHKSIVFDSELNYETMANWKELCLLSLTNKAKLAVDNKHGSIFSRKWIMFREFLNFHSHLAALKSSTVKPDFLRDILSEIDSMLSLWTASNKEATPILFIRKGEALKSLENSKGNHQESCDDKQALNIFLEWLFGLARREKGVELNIAIVSEDPDFATWVQSRMGSADLEIHVYDYLNKDDSRIAFNDLVKKVKAQDNENLKFEDLYQITGGNTDLMHKLVESFVFTGIPFNEDSVIEFTIFTMRRYLSYSQGQKLSTLDAKVLKDTIVRWDGRVMRAFFTEMSVNGYVTSSRFKSRYAELEFLLDTKILYLCLRKPINNDEIDLKEPYITTKTPMERFCMRQALKLSPSIESLSNNLLVIHPKHSKFDEID